MVTGQIYELMNGSIQFNQVHPNLTQFILVQLG